MEDKISDILKKTENVPMPGADEFFYTRLSASMEGRKRSTRSSIAIGAMVVVINCLVITLTISKGSGSQISSEMNPTEQFASMYSEHVKFGIHEGK